MCTAINIIGAHHLFGRTLDVELSYGEAAVITPRHFPLDFVHEGVSPSHLAMMGIACVKDGSPLYYDAVNEAGLAMAALKFPDNAVYHSKKSKGHNVASWELITWILAQCQTLDGALELLCGTTLTNESFSHELPSSPLHFIVADKTGAAVVESVADGVKIYENPFGVLTNNPPFPYHTTRVCDFMGLTSKYPENMLAPHVELSPYSGGLGAVGLPGDFSSSSRFVRAVFAKNHTDVDSGKHDEVSRFFHIMNTVSVPRGCEKNIAGKSLYTLYTSCADTNTMTYYFTTYKNRRIRAMPLHSVNLDAQELVSFDITGTEDIEYLI